MQDNSDLIIRDCCEAEAAKFGKPDTICITVDVLREIVQRHFPGTCLHQIQEPAAAEQAAWHAGLDEGRAQAARTVVVPDDMSSTEANTKYGESYGVDWVYEGKTAAPAAVAVSDDALQSIRVLLRVAKNQSTKSGMAHAIDVVQGELEKIAGRAALAATPAATESREELAHRLIGEVKTADSIATAICQRVAELGDLSSPEDWPEAMLVTGDELHLIAREAVIEAQETSAAAAPVVLPEPVAFALEWTFDGEERGIRLYDDERHCRLDAESDGGVCSPLYTEQQVRALLAGISAPAAVAVAVPDGWREKFAADVYADLAAADNQDVPLEEYPARILKVLDSIVGPRHPVVIKWRNDAIRNCIAIAYKYCRDPESHKYLKQDLEAMLTTEPAPQAQADARDADGEAFRTAARLGLTLRFYGNCAQSGAPGTPSVYEVTTGPDSAEAMRASIDRAAIAAAKGE